MDYKEQKGRTQSIILHFEEVTQMRRTQSMLPCFLALLLAISCSRNGDSTPVVVLAVGDVQVKTPGEGPVPARVAQIIRKGDIITTGPQSHISIQIGDRGIVQVLPESTLEAVSLFESGTCELYLTGGTVISKIDKLGKSGNYLVKTPTSVASVRGTVFSVSYGGAASSIGVSRGSVEVTDIASGKAEQVVIGKAADVLGGITLRDLARTESLVLSKAEAIGYIGNTQTITPEVLEEKGRSFLPALDTIDREIEELDLMSMESIRTKYGRIDVVTLYSGKVYKGAIISRGISIKIITPQGTVELPKDKVKSTVTQ
ncbi:MAG: hypothetical protein EPN93_05345 [Spirochaetes bacterium]|nr:MAG: hypothetical protein EPN93_05345 [Spirochaetota bacterium]